MPKKIARAYGWKPDVPDARDLYYSATRLRAVKLPAKVDLSKGIVQVFDQGQLGSCTAQAIAAAIQYCYKKQDRVPYVPSRLQIYYDERSMEGTIAVDAGAMIRDGFKTIAKAGAAHEKLWPYKPENFAKCPPAKVYQDASKHQAIEYARLVPALSDMRACLYKRRPFVCGISVYESFESDEVAKTGLVPMPGEDERLLGGHAILVVGYDDKKSLFKCLNSWGESWGDKGFFYLPYKYLTHPNLSDDYWTVRTME